MKVKVKMDEWRKERTGKQRIKSRKSKIKSNVKRGKDEVIKRGKKRGR